MNQYSVSQVSSILSVTDRTVYRYINEIPELTPHVIRRKGKRGLTITAQGLELLKSHVNDGQCQTVSDIVGNVSDSSQLLIDTLRDNVRQLSDTVRQRDEVISDLMSSQSEERRRHDTIIMSLTQQIQNQTMLLEDLRHKVSPPPAPRKAAVVPLRSEVPAESHPMSSWTPLQLLAIKLFQPWKLRRDYREKKAA